MAQANKLSEEARKQFERKETVRKVDVREARKYYLIVCEGEKTEPNYFLALVSDLPKPVAEVCRFDVAGAGRSTLSLVEYAVQKRVELEKMHIRDIDYLWIVFDRDSFDADDFNNAIAKCAAENIKKPIVNAAWTNEAFELWYLLHFNYHDTGLTRGQYKEKLEEAVSKVAGSKFVYKKNDPDMYWLLKKHGRLDLAVRSAQKLIDRLWHPRTDYATHNPRTHVHDLVKELFALEENLEKEKE
jgi:hypothetical protein